MLFSDRKKGIRRDIIMKNDAKQDSCEQITFSDIFSSMNIMTDDTCIDLPLDWGEAFDPASGSQDCQAGEPEAIDDMRTSESAVAGVNAREARSLNLIRRQCHAARSDGHDWPRYSDYPARTHNPARPGGRPPECSRRVCPGPGVRAASPMPSFSALPIWAVWISNTWPTFPEKHRIR